MASPSRPNSPSRRTTEVTASVPMDQGVPPSDAERERFAAMLRAGVGSGVLPLDEFEARLDRVYQASSLSELEQLVRWLPSPGVPTNAAPPSRVPTSVVTGRRRVIAVALATVVAGAIAIGLWNASNHSKSKASSATVQLLNSCRLVTTQEMSQALGQQVSAPTRSFVGNTADSCLWGTPDIDHPAANIQLGSDLTLFPSYYRTTDGSLSGLGSQAAIDSSNRGRVLVRKGHLWFEVQVHRTADDRAVALSVARLVVSRLP